LYAKKEPEISSKKEIAIFALLFAQVVELVDTPA
jgi:hypothetical protein